MSQLIRPSFSEHLDPLLLEEREHVREVGVLHTLKYETIWIKSFKVKRDLLTFGSIQWFIDCFTGLEFFIGESGLEQITLMMIWHDHLLHVCIIDEWCFASVLSSIIFWINSKSRKKINQFNSLKLSYCLLTHSWMLLICDLQVEKQHYPHSNWNIK